MCVLFLLCCVRADCVDLSVGCVVYCVCGVCADGVELSVGCVVCSQAASGFECLAPCQTISRTLFLRPLFTKSHPLLFVWFFPSVPYLSWLVQIPFFPPDLWYIREVDPLPLVPPAQRPITFGWENTTGGVVSRFPLYISDPFLHYFLVFIFFCAHHSNFIPSESDQCLSWLFLALHSTDI